MMAGATIGAAGIEFGLTKFGLTGLPELLCLPKNRRTGAGRCPISMLHYGACNARSASTETDTGPDAVGAQGLPINSCNATTVASTPIRTAGPCSTLNSGL